MDEVLAWLTEISQLTDQLLDGQYGTLSDEHIRFLQKVRTLAHERLPELSKDLAPLLIDRTPHEAISQMSTEWRSPLVSIMGFPQLMEQGVGGILNPEQQSIVQKIRTLGEKILNWNRIGYSEYLAFMDDSPADENLP